MRSLRYGCALAALLAPIAVQAQDISGILRGNVVDADGKPVPGAAVTIIHVPSNTRVNQTAGTGGDFNATGLRIGGPFRVDVTAPGFDPASATVQQLAPGTPERVTVSLFAAGQTITVTAARQQRSSISLATGPVTSLNQEAIQGIASINRDIRDLARRDPFVTLDPTNGRALQIAGQNNRFNRFTIDGVQFSDPFGLNAGGLPSTRGPVPIDAICEFNVQTAPVDIQQGNFQGGVLDAVLCSGNNRFHGQAAGYYSSDGLAGRKLYDSDPLFTGARNITVNQKFQSQVYVGQLSGPIVKDRLFFAVTYERTRNTTPADVGLAGEGFANTIPDISRAQVNAVKSAAQTIYGENALDVPSSIPEHDDKVTAKIDFNIAPGHRATLTYIYDKGDLYQGQTSVSNLNSASPALYLQSNNYTLSEVNHFGILQFNDDWSSVFSTQARVSYNSYVRGQIPFGPRTFGQFGVCLDPTSVGSATQCTAGTGQVDFGTDASRQTNQLSVDSYNVELQARIKKNNHDVKLIGERREQDIYNLFVQNSSGTYYFDSLADLNSRTASQLVYAASITGNPNDAAAIFTNDIYTFGIQDNWDLAPNFTFIYGVRYDLYENEGAPAFNQNFFNRNGFRNNVTLSGRGLTEPRLAFVWAPVDGAGPDDVLRQLKLRGTAGRYAGGDPNVWISDSFSNPGTFVNQVTIARLAPNTQTFNTTAFGGFTGTQIGQAALNNVQGGLAGIPSIVTQYATKGVNALSVVNAIDPNFEIPSQYRATLSADARLEFPHVGILNVGADFLYSSVSKGTTWTDLRSVPVGVLPDGRPRYGQRPNTAGPNGTNAADSNADVLLYNSNRGFSFIFDGHVRKDFRSGLSLGASYTIEHVTDVNSGTSSVALSNYNNSVARDPNQAAYGTSNYQTHDTIKANVGFNHAFFGDNMTRINLFYDSRSGQPFSYTFQDALGGSRSPTFGVTGTNSRFLLYVPNVASPTADPIVTYLPSTVNGVSVPFDFAGFQKFVQSSVLNDYQGRIADKNIDRAPRWNKLDLRISQELPLHYGFKIELFGDIENVLNLIDKHEGVLREVAFPYYATVVQTQCANAACTQYAYSNFNASRLATTLYTQASLWQVRVGGRIKF